MRKLIKRLIKIRHFAHKQPSPLVHINISKSALIHNYNEFKDSRPDIQLAPVLKSNAYGHGLSLIANELKSKNPPFFIIDSYFEAMALRNEEIKTPLLIIGYSTVDSIINNNLKDIYFTISNIDTLKELSDKAKKLVNIHLKIDTGMHRQGIDINDKAEAIKILSKNSKIILNGICSHFSDADGINTVNTDKQIIEWNKCVKYFKEKVPTLKYWHTSNSAGSTFKNADSNMFRLGIGLYGLINIKNLNLKPVLEMKTIISGIRKIKKGETLGYNNTFTAEKDLIIATIPVGYNEGIDRRLSNKGYVKIKNTFCRIVGRVSMNITIIDITDILNIKINDEVIVFSSNKDDKNSIENIAKECNTIPYEIAVHIPQYLRRDMVI